MNVFLIDKTGQVQSTRPKAQLHNQKNDTRRTRLDLTVPATTHRRNHLCSSNSVYPSESFIAFRDLIRQGQNSNTRETSKTHSIHNRNPNSKNRNEIPKAGDAKLLLEPTTAKLKKLPPPRNKSRRQRSCESLHLPESKPHYERLHHAITSKQPRLHSKNIDTTGGGWPELRQDGRRR
ncbi:hypothetical protein HID58_053149 [Brassica napus]|uniref:Uncharacterized protein n=1 Tax=Brassica napus TaxID=3708 RepID=A0ABQ8ADW8_BRANA|nr:hypothetical protein HID58_053149 [Brassica napus]